LKVNVLEYYDYSINDNIYKEGDVLDVVEMVGFEDSYAIYRYGGLDWIPKKITQKLVKETTSIIPTSKIDFEFLARRVEIIRALIGMDGELTMTDTEYNHDSIILNGFKRNGNETKSVKYYIGESEILELVGSKNFLEVHKVYKEIGYFKST